MTELEFWQSHVEIKHKKDRFSGSVIIRSANPMFHGELKIKHKEVKGGHIVSFMKPDLDFTGKVYKPYSTKKYFTELKSLQIIKPFNHGVFAIDQELSDEDLIVINSSQPLQDHEICPFVLANPDMLVSIQVPKI